MRCLEIAFSHEPIPSGVNGPIRVGKTNLHSLACIQSKINFPGHETIRIRRFPKVGILTRKKSTSVFIGKKMAHILNYCLHRLTILRFFGNLISLKVIEQIVGLNRKHFLIMRRGPICFFCIPIKSTPHGIK